MKITLISDLNIELAQNPIRHIKKFIPEEPTEQVLVLAGDIGNPSSKIYRIFLYELSKIYAKVFIIAGNHEYYQKYNRRSISKFNSEGLHLGDASFRHSIEEVDKLIEIQVSSLPNVHFLQRTVFIYNRVRFLGCTLWSEVDRDAAHKMNDFEMIKGMTTDKYRELHSRDVEWLSEMLKVQDESQYDHTIVITHHLPTTELIAEKFQNETYRKLNVFFASNLEEIVKNADIWLCGHSHSAKEVKIGKCSCYLNPVGYTNEKTSFDPSFQISLDSF